MSSQASSDSLPLGACCEDPNPLHFRASSAASRNLFPAHENVDSRVEEVPRLSEDSMSQNHNNSVATSNGAIYRAVDKVFATVHEAMDKCNNEKLAVSIFKDALHQFSVDERIQNAAALRHEELLGQYGLELRRNELLEKRAATDAKELASLRTYASLQEDVNTKQTDAFKQLESYMSNWIETVKNNEAAQMRNISALEKKNALLVAQSESLQSQLTDASSRLANRDAEIAALNNGSRSLKFQLDSLSSTLGQTQHTVNDYVKRLAECEQKLLAATHAAEGAKRIADTKENEVQNLRGQIKGIAAKHDDDLKTLNARVVQQKEDEKTTCLREWQWKEQEYIRTIEGLHRDVEAKLKQAAGEKTAETTKVAALEAKVQKMRTKLHDFEQHLKTYESDIRDRLKHDIMKTYSSAFYDIEREGNRPSTAKENSRPSTVELSGANTLKRVFADRSRPSSRSLPHHK